MLVFRLQLLGAFQAAVGETAVTAFRSDKIRALLAYLALNGNRTHSRDSLAALLWGDYSQTAARTSLRQALSNLRQAAAPLLAVQPPALTITPQAVTLDTTHPALWVDVVVLRRLLAQVNDHDHADPARCPECRHWLETAVALYHGDFLPGLQLDDAPDFADWRLLQQETLHQQALHALQSLSASYAAAGDLPRQGDTLRRLLHLHPWQENAHRDLMDVLARSGQRAAALAQYARCRQILADELGVEPAAETTALYRLIQADTLPTAASGRAAAPSQPGARHNLPPPATPLIGREELLAQVSAALTARDTRLLTLLGPGGVGKTRLALAAARQVTPDFAGGVWFVSLADVTLPAVGAGMSQIAAQMLATAVTDQLGLDLQQPGKPWETLTAYLHPKTALLILDNLEHLLPAAAHFVTALLDACPQLTILATSQARLRARAEQPLPLTGLALPEAGAVTLETAVANGSIALFAARAGRTLAGFQLDAANVTAVADICRLVDGLPLAIELTAALTEHFTPEEIATTLRHNIALLASSPGALDLPPRQQSITAVFDYAWRLLTPPEQALLAQISLFRGEFSRTAALEVSQGSLAALAALVDKSLLRVARPGRYTLHALVRHFAATALQARPDLHAAARERYGRIYVTFMQQQLPRLQGPQQRAAIAALRQEMDNVRQVWWQAIAAHDQEALSALAEPLGHFWDDQGHHQEGIILFAPAAALADLPRDVAARLRAWLGFFHFRLANYPQSQALLHQALAEAPALPPATRAFAHYALGCLRLEWGQLEEARAQLTAASELYAGLQAPAALANVLTSLGRLHELVGQYDQARETLQRSLALKREAGAPRPIANSLTNLALLLQRQGDNETARHYLQESLAIAEEFGNQTEIGACLANLGLVDVGLGSYASAAALLQRALAIQEQVGNRTRMAIALNNLGDVANHLGNYAEGIAYLRQSLAIKEEMGNQRGMTFSLVHLGHAYLALGQREEARRCYARTLALAQELAMPPLLLAALVGWAQLMAQEDDAVGAVALLQLPLHHPAAWQRVRDEAAGVETAVLATSPLPPDQLEAARAAGRTVTLETAVVDILRNR